MPVALDRRVAYYGTYLSDNIVETPDGYLICKNAVIGRTGYQTYRVDELQDPEGLLRERNYAPDELLQIYRAPEEVFSDATLASFEGKTFTFAHPDRLLGPDNDAEHNQGHVQNVRRGKEPLESGDYPLLADVIVKGQDAIDAIRAGSRELSCGYTYRLAREGYRWDQRKIVGNHVALVQKGRAGAEARINDSALDVPVRREERSVKISNYLKHLLGEGIKVFAKDAAPEELTAALRDPLVAAAAELDEKKLGESNVLSIVHDRAATEVTDKPKMVYVGKTADGVRIWKEAPGTSSAADEAAERERQAAVDAKAKTEREKLHAKLEEILTGKSTAVDKDLEAFTQGLAAFVGDAEETEEEKKAKDGHPEGCKCKDCMAKDTETEKEAIEEDSAETEEERRKKEEEESEDADIVRPEPVLAANQDPENALTARDVQLMVADAQLGMLRMLKPFVAKSKSEPLIKAFDTAMNTFTKILRKGKGEGSYAKFMKAAATAHDTEHHVRSTGKDGEITVRVSPTEKANQEAEALYAEAGKKARQAYRIPGGRSVN